MRLGVHAKSNHINKMTEHYPWSAPIRVRYGIYLGASAYHGTGLNIGPIGVRSGSDPMGGLSKTFYFSRKDKSLGQLCCHFSRPPLENDDPWGPSPAPCGGSPAVGDLPKPVHSS